MHRIVLAGCLVGTLLGATAASAGPFADPSIADTDSRLVAWADGVAGFAPAPSGGVAGQEVRALGAPDEVLVSLGELDAAALAAGLAPGSITLTFSRPLYDGPGADLAVFENAGAFFPDPFVFAELGFVEVSSNGTDFARFPTVSLNTVGAGNPDTDLVTPFGTSFAGLNRTNVTGFAGIHGLRQGTLFDLAALATDPLVAAGLLDLGGVGYVRIVDVPGNGSFADSLGGPILDAWPTAGTGGLDLDAVGALYVVPEPGTMALVGLGLLLASALRPQRA